MLFCCFFAFFFQDVSNHWGKIHVGRLLRFHEALLEGLKNPTF